MILDCVTFGWELDLLECRLLELADVVDHFVICEAPATFQGHPKPLHFPEHRHRFAPWADRITYVVADLPPGDPWQREYAQRDAMNDTLRRFPSDATVLIGDVDEIPSPQALTSGRTGPWVARCTTYSMAVDWLLPYSVECTVVAPNWQAQEWGLAEMRKKRLSVPAVDSGWHFTWLGGPDLIRRKAASFSHTEASVQDYVRSMGDRLYIEGYHVLGEKLTAVDVDDTYPRYIAERRCPPEWFRPRQ